MAFFRLRSLSGNHWPKLPAGNLSQVWAAYLALDRTQWLEPAELERCQLIQLRALLDHCYEQVPYYRRMLETLRITSRSIESMADYRRLPLLSRPNWQEHFDDFHARQLPPETVALDEDSTSGSTGTPVRILKTNFVYVWWLACYLRDLEWSGLDPTGSMAAIRATFKTGVELDQLLQGIQLPSWNPVLEPLIEMGPLYGMDISQKPERQLDWLRQIDPDYLLSQTSNLEMLAAILRDEPRKFPRLRAIQAISETLGSEAQVAIEEAFGAPVRNLYSCAEAGYLASHCPSRNGMHVHAENVILEVLDDADQPCKPGETGRVILTTLHNFRTPFIRYEIGDRVTLGLEPCQCGRGLPLLARIEGKRRPMFCLAGNRRKHSSGLVHAISGVGNHYQHQAEQVALDQVVVRIVPGKLWTAGHSDRLRHAVQEFFESPIRVDLEIIDRLDLPRSGKLQSMICEL